MLKTNKVTVIIYSLTCWGIRPGS